MFFRGSSSGEKGQKKVIKSDVGRVVDLGVTWLEFFWQKA